ncbi:nucleotidyltransferase family protein [Intrasporangium sp. DVR]|uniref:nucleotidyltransferase family protein n=1 Tax=Intrasporangium sp. DVR TaxID=3127867 RepID=UPI00313A4F8B
MPLSSIPHVRGLLLAAGSGSRMGGPKALLRPSGAGPTLVERAVAVLLEGGCDGVTVVVGAAAAEVAAVVAGGFPEPSTVGVDVVPCPEWAEGMGASLRAGLAAAATRRDVEALVVSLVDLPDVDAPVVHRLLQSREGHWTAALSRAAYGGRPGHPTLIGRDHWTGVVTVARGDRGARDFFHAQEHDLVECGDLATGRDVDAPTDLDS